MKKLSFFVCLFVLSFSLLAQESGTLIEQHPNSSLPFTITKYSNASGLPQNEVRDIIPLNDGHLLILTTNGIVRYNGKTFHEFLTNDEYKKIGYHKLLNQNDLLIGIGTDGISALLAPFFCEIPVPSGELISDCIFFGDTLIVATRPGNLYKLDKRLHYHRLATLPLGRRNKIHRLAIHNSRLFAGTKTGLFSIDLFTGEYKKILTPDVMALNINPFNEDIYAACDNVIYRITPRVEEIYDLSKIGSLNAISQIGFVDTSGLFITTTKGFYFVDNDSILFEGDSTMPSRYLKSQYYDPVEDCLLLGSVEKGILKLQLKTAQNIWPTHYVQNPSAGSIIETSDHKVLYAEHCCNISEIKGNMSFKFIDKSTHYATISSYENKLYVGTWGKGVRAYENNKQIEKSSYKTQNKVVHAIYRDTQKRLWVGTDKGIECYGEKGQFKKVFERAITSKVVCFYELSNGYICIGSSQGVFIINGDKIFLKIDQEGGLMGKEVRAFYEDKEGKLWIGTYGGGLYCYDGATLSNINQMNGAMLDKDVFCLAKDDWGYLYMTSNHGLYRIKEEKLDSFYKGKLDYLIPFHYGPVDGMVNPEFNGGFQNNFLKASDGYFYFPSVEGVVKVHPEKLVFRKLKTHIDEVYVNDSIIDITENQFDRSTYSIQFKFSSISFLNKYNIYYQHRLLANGETDNEGRRWSHPQKSDEVHLKMLPPGNYKFQVRSLDGFNDPEPQVTEFEFTILPYFYETTLFIVLIVVAAIILVVFIIYVRSYYVRKHTREKERLRQGIAEFELKAIQSKINPHFIFNSLSSIKYFMVSGKMQEAEKYLDHFSSLIRKFMESSEILLVKVEEEVKILNEYLEIEKMRIGNEMDYSIVIEEGAGDCILPSMITQPHVENAIKHGISHLESKGNIHIVYRRVGELLVISITDNGIGRKKSSEINKNRPFHTSMGNILVNERIQMMKKLFSLNAEVNIVDLNETSSNTTGTEVTITVQQRNNAI